MDTTRRLPDGELAVMQALWDLEPPVTSGELQQQLKESHPMALTTPAYGAHPACRQEFVKIRRRAAAAVLPAHHAGSYLAGQSRRFLDQLCGGSLSAFAAACVTAA